MAIKNSLLFKGFLLLAVSATPALAYYLYMANVDANLDLKDIKNHKSFKTYLNALDYKLVDEETTEDTLQNILLQRLFPNYRSDLTYEENKLFEGSPKAIFTKNELETNNGSKKRGIILKKDETGAAQKLKEACIQALDKDPENDLSTAQKLKEWCTVPTVADVLKRHKFKLNIVDYHWKQVVKSAWFTDKNGSDLKHKDNQSFFEESELEKLNNGTENEKLEIIKKRCEIELNKPFERKNFPMPTSLIRTLNSEGKVSEKESDKFQEAAIFCTQPITAQNYVEDAMQGTIRTSFDDYIKKHDFCYIENKEVNDYKQVTNIDPLEGKTFWCAVRLIYDKHKGSSQPSAIAS